MFLLFVGFCIGKRFCFEQLVKLMDRVSPIEQEAPPEEGQQDEEENEDDKKKKGKSSDNNKSAAALAKEKQKTRGQWTLDIRILQARNLPPSDIPILDSFLVGLADPYATIGLRNKKRETKIPYEPLFATQILKSTLHPVWDEAFRTQFNSEEDEISIQVWDKDRLKPDDYIGEALIPTRRLVQKYREMELTTNREVTYDDAQWYELYDRRGRVVTGGRKRGVKSEDVAAVEIQLRLDKTYDPAEAVIDMKKAIDFFRTRTKSEEEQKKKMEREQARQREKDAKAQQEGLRASQLPPMVKQRSQALKSAMDAKAPRDQYMAKLPVSDKNKAAAAAKQAKAKKKKAAATKKAPAKKVPKKK